MPKMNGNFGKCSECAKVSLLSNGLAGVGRSCRNKCSEIFDALNRIAGEQKLAHLLDVEPTIRSSFERSVVQIETVYVDVSNQPGRQKCKSRPGAALRPATEATGGI